MIRGTGVLIAIVVLANPFLLSGCGGSAEQYDVVPVSGILTCEGEPVANVAVNFRPLDTEGRVEGRPGRPAIGITDANGRFTLTTYEDDDGAVMGRHEVTVGMAQIIDTPGDPNVGFACKDATIEITVEAGMEEVHLDL